MQVTAPKPVERADRRFSTPRETTQTISTTSNDLKNLIHQVQKPPEDQDPRDFSMESGRKDFLLITDSTRSVSQAQSMLAHAETIDEAITQLLDFIGQKKNKPAGMSPEKAKEFRDKIAEYAEHISSKTKDLQLSMHFMGADGTLQESEGKKKFESYLDDGLDFLKLADKKDTKKQLREFDENMKKKLEEIREFKKLLAKRVQERAEKAKQLQQSQDDASEMKTRLSSPRDVVKATAEAIMNSLSDPSLLHPKISRKRSVHLLTVDSEEDDQNRKAIQGS